MSIRNSPYCYRIMKKKNNTNSALIVNIVVSTVLTFAITMLALQNNRLAGNLSECKEANQQTNDTIREICQLPFVDCYHENTQSL